MLAGQYRLRQLGITTLTHPARLSSAMNQLPDKTIALAVASHIARELQIAPWNLSSNFVACTKEDEEKIERLEITDVGNPSGQGLGFSYDCPNPPHGTTAKQSEFPIFRRDPSTTKANEENQNEVKKAKKKAGGSVALQ
ncbi:unnamed protein product [Fraxinus pennsylvanica]|uniref:Transcription initiation factor TFIID subunit 1 histone acetyltransferase domain-containing protein n=1 Tax=Fraxinus pennsylvanica TaxID=56036 RepID=A0AAD2E6S1_9LAMI|nr:unnamed protein product [Fraxinus pennsylvanica]